MKVRTLPSKFVRKAGMWVTTKFEGTKQTQEWTDHEQLAGLNPRDSGTEKVLPEGDQKKTQSVPEPTGN